MISSRTVAQNKHQGMEKKLQPEPSSACGLVGWVPGEGERWSPPPPAASRRFQCTMPSLAGPGEPRRGAAACLAAGPRGCALAAAASRRALPRRLVMRLSTGTLCSPSSMLDSSSRAACRTHSTAALKTRMRTELRLGAVQCMWKRMTMQHRQVCQHQEQWNPAGTRRGEVREDRVETVKQIREEVWGRGQSWEVEAVCLWLP